LHDGGGGGGDGQTCVRVCVNQGTGTEGAVLSGCLRVE
jgi:hypothetical protein